jgi:hypothetical protein
VVALAAVDSRVVALVLVGDGDDHGALREANSLHSIVGHRAHLGDDVTQIVELDLVGGPRLAEGADAGFEVLHQRWVLLDKVGTVFWLLNVVHGLVVRCGVSPLRSARRGGGSIGVRTGVRVGRGDARGGRPKCAQKTQDTHFAAASVQDARSFLQFLPPLHSDSHWSSTLKNYRERSVVSEAGGVGLWAREGALPGVYSIALGQARTRCICLRHRSYETGDGGARVSVGQPSLVKVDE